MKHHTFIVGTSKMNPVEEGYYIPYPTKFWGTLQEAGITDTRLHHTEYQRLGKESGIYLTEIVDPAEHIEKEDSAIKPHQIQSGMEALKDRIQSHEPHRIGLKNKNAGAWFYSYCEEDMEVTSTSDQEHAKVKRNLEHGPLDWDYFGLDYYLLPTLSYFHWNEDSKEDWLDFCDLCSKDVEQYQRKRATP